jgi:CubicO group peptidase (beta-lactamase class C family)
LLFTGDAEGFGYGFGEWLGKNTAADKPAEWATSPGLFGSYPWIDNQNQYSAFLMSFYLNNKGRSPDTGIKKIGGCSCSKGLIGIASMNHSV